MKNLSNCTPSEFFKQTYLIKKSISEWLDVTKLMDIRKNKPELISLAGLTGEEREKAVAENKSRIQAQAMKNFGEIFDSAFGENADKTLEVLALCCFVEPEHVDDYPVSEYLKSINELISDENVLSFFTSLAQLATKNTAIVSRR